MNVIFISQCQKKALNRTRKVLDAYANRIGSHSWQTAITEEGLAMVRKLLRQTASKNTAVSCHRISTRKRTELEWIIGNRQAFNESGFVPVNRTQKDFSIYQDSHLWQNLPLVSLASAIAGLFHDFGKANDLFQNKLNPNIKTKNYEPYRHEWVSFKLFESFTKNKTNEQWLALLANPTQINADNIIQNITDKNNFKNFHQLSDFAKLVAWLIVSHHRILAYPFGKDNFPQFSQLKTYDDIYEQIDIKWNSPNYQKQWESQIKELNWQFSYHLPFYSQTWQNRAKEIANQALNHLPKINEFKWESDILTAHLARMSLMWADHYYSSKNALLNQQDSNYHAYANTDKNHQYKQKLDEHNIMVSLHAHQFSQQLPRFLSELPPISYNKVLEKGIENANSDLSKWQNQAFLTSQKSNMRANECGFFGINLASTGKGKTFANARIMYALADPEKGLRLNIALGLRTLSLQTGQALKDLLKLDDEIATLIGSNAILQLFNKNNEKENNELLKQQQQLLEDLERTALAYRGSESLDDDDDFDVEYAETHIEKDSKLYQLFKNQPKYQKLLHAPILVSTIDYLMPATESLRGGKQIAPMLRLLSSDLVLDEPDEFGIDDWFALTRLVHWAGMLGSKVLLSSATIPPAMAQTLFNAYQNGRQIYQKNMAGHNEHKPIICGWFDEFSAKTAEISDDKSYIKSHSEFIKERINNLTAQTQITQRAKIIPISQNHQTIFKNMADTIFETFFIAHQSHHQTNNHINLSFGVVRFANINPLVAVAKTLIEKDVPDDYCVYYCIYHSQFTLAKRSFIEEKLDRILNRKNANAIFSQPEIQTAIDNNPNAKHHIFVVLATSVCEVGRDHDYDWAIAEPSSMRSLIQLSGRVQRHRKQIAHFENIFILEHNIKALKGKEIAYHRPGFESKKYHLTNKNLNQILKPEHYQNINAISAIKLIQPNISPYDDLLTLEHSVQWAYLLGALKEANNAMIWFRQPVTWLGEIQRQQPFRRSAPEKSFVYQHNSQGKLRWYIRDKADYNKLIETGWIQNNFELTYGKNSTFWFECDDEILYNELAEFLGKPIEVVERIYGEIKVTSNGENFCYHPLLGMFQAK